VPDVLTIVEVLIIAGRRPLIQTRPAVRKPAVKAKGRTAIETERLAAGFVVIAQKNIPAISRWDVVVY
jgi:hypothetical protein